MPVSNNDIQEKRSVREKIVKDFKDLKNPTNAIIKDKLSLLQRAIKGGGISKEKGHSELFTAIQKIYVQTLNGQGSFEKNKDKFFTKNLQNTVYVFYGNKQIATMGAVAARKYELLQLPPAFAGLLGKITLPFSAMISGKPGSGKTTFIMLLMKALATAYPDKKILFVSNEERRSPAMAEKIKRFGLAAFPNIYLVEDMIKMWSCFDFVFVDSVNSLNIGIEDFKKQIAESEKEKKGIFYIFQATKQGIFKGVSGFEHEVSVSLSAEGGEVSVRKNRFGGAGTFKVWE